MCRRLSRAMFSVTILVTLTLSATATWKVRTLPPRSTRATIARLFAGPLAALGEGFAAGATRCDCFSIVAVIGFVGLHDLAFAAHGGRGRQRAWLRGYGGP